MEYNPITLSEEKVVDTYKTIKVEVNGEMVETTINLADPQIVNEKIIKSVFADGYEWFLHEFIPLNNIEKEYAWSEDAIHRRFPDFELEEGKCYYINSLG